MAETDAVLLFDKEGATEVAEQGVLLGDLDDDQLLWIDRGSDGRDDAELSLDLEAELARRLGEPAERPSLITGESSIFVTVSIPVEGQEFTPLRVLMGRNWVVTAHDGRTTVLDGFRELAEGAGELGSLDGPSFLATVLEWVFDAYREGFEAIELELAEFDVRALEGRLGDPDEEVQGLVRLRQGVGRLRRELVKHRVIVTGLAHSELDALSTPESAARFSCAGRPAGRDHSSRGRRPRCARRVVRRDHRAQRASDEPDHEGPGPRHRPLPSGVVSRRADGRQLQGRLLLERCVLLGAGLRDRGQRGHDARRSSGAWMDLTPWSARRLVQAVVTSRGIALGRPVDLLFDAQLEYALGLDVLLRRPAVPLPAVARVPPFAAVDRGSQPALAARNGRGRLLPPHGSLAPRSPHAERGARRGRRPRRGRPRRGRAPEAVRQDERGDSLNVDFAVAAGGLRGRRELRRRGRRRGRPARRARAQERPAGRDRRRARSGSWST